MSACDRSDLPARGGHQRRAAGRRAGAPRPRPQPDLRRARRRVDRLRGPGDGLHVPGLLPGHGLRLARVVGRPRWHRPRRSARPGRPPAHHHAHPELAARQSAPGHRRPALLHPVVRDVPVDHRSSVDTDQPARGRGRRPLPVVRAPDRLRIVDRGHARPLGLPAPHVHRHGHPGRRPGPRRDGFNGRRPAAHFHRDDVHPARRHPGPARAMIGRAAAVAVLLALVVAPFVPMGGMRQYVLHVVIQIFIWSFIGGAWSLMGRFGLVSLGHGAFLGVGAYTTTLLWNFYGLTPSVGTFVAMAAAVVLALIVAYPCSRFGIIGHYFALVTLAVGEVVRLLIIAERDWTGGSLGLTLKTAGAGGSLLAAQSANKRVFYYDALIVWLLGLWVGARLDRSMARAAMEAI